MNRINITILVALAMLSACTIEDVNTSAFELSSGSESSSMGVTVSDVNDLIAEPDLQLACTDLTQGWCTWGSYHDQFYDPGYCGSCCKSIGLDKVVTAQLMGELIYSAYHPAGGPWEGDLADGCLHGQVKWWCANNTTNAKRPPIACPEGQDPVCSSTASLKNDWLTDNDTIHTNPENDGVSCPVEHASNPLVECHGKSCPPAPCYGEFGEVPCGPWDRVDKN